MSQITKNTGLQQEQILGAKDWMLGGVNALQQGIIRPDGQWGDFLPAVEKQNVGGFDVYCCVSFAQLNIIETYAKARYNTDLNLSDRFLGALSETVCGSGNWMSKVADTFRENGGVPEEMYPWGGDSCPVYVDPNNISDELKDEAKKFLDEWEVNWAWSYNTNLNDIDETKEALKYSPVSVSLAYDYGTMKGDVFQRTEKRPYHCVMLYGYKEGEYWLIFDHYDWSIKKLAWDYIFGAKLSTQLIKKINKPPMSDAQKVLEEKGLDKGTFLVQQTGPGATGEFGVLIDSKLYVDDLDKILATYLVRDGKNGGGLVPEIWNGLQKFNLKNEQL